MFVVPLYVFVPSVTVTDLLDNGCPSPSVKWTIRSVFSVEVVYGLFAVMVIMSSSAMFRILLANVVKPSLADAVTPF